MASPKVRAVVSLVCPCCPWLVPTPKGSRMSSNHFVWFHAGPCEWVSLSILPNPIPELQPAPLPLKGLWARERAPTPPYSAAFLLGLTFESFEELGVRQQLWCMDHLQHACERIDDGRVNLIKCKSHNFSHGLNNVRFHGQLKQALLNIQMPSLENGKNHRGRFVILGLCTWTQATIRIF